jgi:hypothetical protein
MARTRGSMRRYGNWRKSLQDYDSKFERDLHAGVLSSCEFHPEERIEYVTKHKYSPDFKYTAGDITYLIESKGRFAESHEATKYIRIRECLPERYELVFLFQTPSLPMPRAKKRKDGSIATHASWADKNGFRWFDIDTIKMVLF